MSPNMILETKKKKNEIPTIISTKNFVNIRAIYPLEIYLWGDLLRDCFQVA
jgi:hypothetical protein